MKAPIKRKQILIKKMGLGARFVFLGLSFVLTLAVASYQLNARHNLSIEFAQKEHMGIEYLRSVRALMERLPQHRLMAHHVLQGSDAEKPALLELEKMLDGDVQGLLAQDTKYSDALKTSVSVKAFSRRWSELKEKILEMHSGDSGDNHRMLMAELRALATDIGDSSNLITDPELQGYYLIDAMLLKLPEGQEQVPQLIYLADYAVQEGPALDDKDRSRLSLVLGIARANMGRAEKSFSRAFQADETGASRRRLEPLLSDYTSLCTGFFDTIESDLIRSRNPEFTTESARLLGRKVLDANFRLWDETAAVVDGMLERRIDGVQLNKNIIFFVMAFLAMITGLSGVMIAHALWERRYLVHELTRLAQAVNSASDGIVITDPKQPDNPIIYANTTFSKITGYPIEDILGRNCRFMQGPETDRGTLEEVRQAIKAKKSIKVTLINYRKDGSKFWNGLRISPVFSKDGKIQYYLGFQADVTERKEAEMTLIAERDYTASILRSTPAVICGISPEGSTTFINPTGEKVTGYSSRELIGKNWWSTFYPGKEYEQVEKLLQHFQHSNVRDYEMTLTTKTGEKRTISWNSMNRTDADGETIEIIGFGDDVTERKKAEEELRQSEEAFRFMMLSAPVMIWMAGLDKKFIYVNRFWAEFTGRKVAEELGEGWMEGVHPEDRTLLQNTYSAAFQDRLNFKMEFRLRHVTGEYRWVTTTGTPSFKDDGSFAGFIGSCLDVHERKKLEGQLLQSQKMETVGTLAGGIAHDLNNQLTPLSGYIDLVMRDTNPGDKKRELLVEAEQAARRCAEVVQRLMNFSRTSTQKKSWLKVQAVMEELRNLLPKFLTKTVSTEVTFAPDLWPVMGNDTELQTVLLNLSTNARDAMPEGGKLQVTAENKKLDVSSVRGGHSPGPYVLISVKDSGQGIPQHLLTKIFEPFYTTKQKGQGTGLGLAMVFRIVRDHGGWLDVSSTVDRGTTFQIYLPADPTQKAVKGDVGTPEVMPRGNETILFVDDEETLRNLGRVFLERLGYKVLLAQDGEEAVQLYQERRAEIDAVVLDMTMPKLTGRQAMKKMLEIDPTERILLASGYTSEGSAKELIQEGAVDFLAKPYTILPLAQALRKVIGQP